MVMALFMCLGCGGVPEYGGGVVMVLWCYIKDERTDNAFSNINEERTSKHYGAVVSFY